MWQKKCFVLHWINPYCRIMAYTSNEHMSQQWTNQTLNQHIDFEFSVRSKDFLQLNVSSPIKIFLLSIIVHFCSFLFWTVFFLYACSLNIFLRFVSTSHSEIIWIFFQKIRSTEWEISSNRHSLLSIWWIEEFHVKLK